MRPLCIAIAALGGQGGGVLADWLVKAAELHGWIAQSTSIPGVAQRTGTTVYYVEVCPAPLPGEPRPVLALMPSAGDVDLVVAAELMEAGRSVVRGLVTPGRTTLVSSNHRVYGITEKSALGDGIADANAVLAALHSQSKRLICFDMDVIAGEHNSVISSVLFGAVAGSAALPFPRALYERAISESGVAVKSNLAGFAAGFDRALQDAPVTGLVAPATGPTSALGRRLDERIGREFPAHLHGLLEHGVKRMLDYQDGAYADLYLDRLAGIRDGEQRAVHGGHDYALTAAVGRYLALWMSYEDTIRVADLKTRGARFDRFRAEVGAGQDQIVHVTEFMHPRFEEMCETLPAGFGGWLLRSEWARRALAPLFRKGRHIRTTHLGGFLMLRLIAGMRRWRRASLRYRIEETRINEWLQRVQSALAAHGREVAIELAECQRLVKGYGDTHARGWQNYGSLMQAIEEAGPRADLAEVIKRLRNAALADEEGERLRATLVELGLSVPASMPRVPPGFEPQPAAS